MFEWKVEEMALTNNHIRIHGHIHYDCEDKVSREDKIAFVDSMQDGKLSYLLGLIDKFNKDKDGLPKSVTCLGSERVKTVSLKAWINRNDTKYKKPILDNWYKYGTYHFLGCERDIQSNRKGQYDKYEDLVDELFYRQLRECEGLEGKYFRTHDEYSVLKSKLKDCIDLYGVTFGVRLGICSDGRLLVYDEEHKKSREITIDEINVLISKYNELGTFVENLSKDINITY